MNKNELIDAIAAEGNLTKADSKKALEAFEKTIISVLKKGDRIALVGFGTFSVVKRSARIGRNPQTGKPLNIKARNACKFKAGRELSNTVN
ncbi:MAG TPA: HU family DNA-binding protein [Bacteroidales bacterium]|nr:HU family DNA-binding protein [Bacteroidales bacterium]